MQSPRTLERVLLVAGTALTLGTSACISVPSTGKLAATSSAISETDLRARLALFAADSMDGRSAGTSGHKRAVRYLVSEVTRLGLSPAGDDGTFLQTFFMRRRQLDPASAIAVNGRILRPTVDFRAISTGRGPIRPVDGAEVIFGGIVGEPSTQISPGQAAGRVVVLGVPLNMNSARAFANVLYGPTSRFADALAVAIASLDYVPVAQRGINASIGLADSTETLANQQPTTLLVSTDAAVALMGMPLRSATAGAKGRTITGRLAVIEEDRPTQNVVALIRGADPELRGQYVVLGAHSDHLPIASRIVDHDSTRAVSIERNRSRLPVAQRTVHHASASGDTERHTPVRLDSIFNGADDDGSGSVALLEIAELMAASHNHQGRSVLFVWHSAEEDIYMGSRWLVAHPPVPTDSMITMVNLDMVGRGGVDDIASGGPRYVEVIGADRRSPALLTLIADVNRRSNVPATLVTSDPGGGFCRSDQWNYARQGIPVAFFTTGSHADYHSVTDEDRYIDYPKLALVTKLVAALTAELASTREQLEPHGKRVVLADFCSG